MEEQIHDKDYEIEFYREQTTEKEAQIQILGNKVKKYELEGGHISATEIPDNDERVQ